MSAQEIVEIFLGRDKKGGQLFAEVESGIEEGDVANAWEAQCCGWRVLVFEEVEAVQVVVVAKTFFLDTDEDDPFLEEKGLCGKGDPLGIARGVAEGVNKL